MVVTPDLDTNLVQPLLAACPDLGAIQLLGIKSSTTRLGLALYNMARLQFLHLDTDGHVTNFYNAFKAKTCTQVLQAIFKRAPNLIGLFIPLPDESVRLDLSSVKFPQSLHLLGLKSHGSNSTVDIHAVENLKVQHLALVNLRIEAPEWSYSEDSDDLYEDLDPKYPWLYIGGDNDRSTMEIFSDIVLNRP